MSGASGTNRSPQSPCPHPCRRGPLPQRGGGEAGLSAVATQPQPLEPQLPGPAPHMGIIMLQQPGSQATHQHFYGGGRGQARAGPATRWGNRPRKVKSDTYEHFSPPPFFSPLKSKLMLLLLHGWLHFMTHTVQTITAPGGRGYRAIHSWGGGALNSHPRALTSRNAWMKGQESEGAPWHTAHKEAHREPPRGHLVGGD